MNPLSGALVALMQWDVYTPTALGGAWWWDLSRLPNLLFKHQRLPSKTNDMKVFTLGPVKRLPGITMEVDYHRFVEEKGHPRDHAIHFHDDSSECIRIMFLLAVCFDKQCGITRPCLKQHPDPLGRTMFDIL